MIKTIVLEIVNGIDLGELPRLYSSMVRISYNRAKEGMGGNDIRPYLQERFPEINSWLVHSAEVDGTTIHKSNVDEHKIHFGGKKTYEKYMKGQITKEEYRHSKIMPIYSLGEACRCGNRLFDFDLNECKLTFKPSKNIHIPIEFKPTKRMEELRKLQVLIDSGAVALTVRLTNRNVFLSYEETGINLTTLRRGPTHVQSKSSSFRPASRARGRPAIFSKCSICHAKWQLTSFPSAFRFRRNVYNVETHASLTGDENTDSSIMLELL